MTVLPAPPGAVLTSAQYAGLGEDEGYRWELQEGNLVMTPSPTPAHSQAMGSIYRQLHGNLPVGLSVLQDVDVDLQLAPPDQPGWVRRPDVLVVQSAEVERVNSDGGLLQASAVRLVVEIASPGSRRTDFVIKRGEYAEAGIDHYWIIDLAPSASLLVQRLSGERGYVDSAERTGVVAVAEPGPLTIDLTDLT